MDVCDIAMIVPAASEVGTSAQTPHGSCGKPSWAVRLPGESHGVPLFVTPEQLKW